MNTLATGVIFSNIHDSTLHDLTRMRSTAAIPFGCRYRLIDFALSNMVNSGIFDVNIITHNNYHSLMDHIGSGKDWDLARRSGGVRFLPPFITAYANAENSLYTTRLEALESVNYSISSFNSKYVILSDCDVVCNIDLREVLEKHIESEADATFVVKRTKANPEMAKHSIFIDSDRKGNVTGFTYKPDRYDKEADVSLNITVLNRSYLQEIVSEAISHHYWSLTRDIYMKDVSRKKYKVFKYKDPVAEFTSFEDYFNVSMELIKNEEFFNHLFGNPDRPIYTKIRNSAPTYFSKNSYVKDSLIADGCIIEGSVENSILFRGVKVGKDTMVMNSILFQDTFTGENVTLQYVVSDKDVVIRDGVSISGHSTMPVYIEKGRML